MLKNQIYILITLIILIVQYAATAATDQGHLMEPASSSDPPTSVSPPNRPT